MNVRLANIATVATLLCSVHVSEAAAQATEPRITVQTTGSTTTLFSVSAVNDHVVWTSGGNGTVLRTLDGGTTWEKKSVPGGERLAFSHTCRISPLPRTP